MTPSFQKAELVCKDAPAGQLAYSVPADVVAERIRLGDAAGEDCRQKLNRARMKIEVTQEVVDEINERNNVKKDDED